MQSTKGLLRNFDVRVSVVSQANLDLKRFEEAERDASVALRYEPENSKARYRRARARFQRQQPNIHGACADLVTVVKKDPTQKEARRMAVVPRVDGVTGVGSTMFW